MPASTTNKCLDGCINRYNQKWHLPLLLLGDFMHIQNSGHPEFTWKSQGKKPVEFEVFVLVLMAKINGWFNLVRKGGFILIMLCEFHFLFFLFFGGAYGGG